MRLSNPTFKIIAMVLLGFFAVTGMSSAAHAQVPAGCVANCGGAPASTPDPTDPTIGSGFPSLIPEEDFYFPTISTSGAVTLVKPDGQSYSGQMIANIRISPGDRLITGVSGSVRLTIVDGSIIRLQANTEIVLDAYEIYDVATLGPVRRYTIGLVKGIFNWVSNFERSQRKSRVTIKTQVAHTAVRGTEFEMEATPWGSGYIKLFSGELEITPFGGSPYILYAGQMVSYENFKDYGPAVTLASYSGGSSSD